jgi:hypothetical protein
VSGYRSGFKSTEIGASGGVEKLHLHCCNANSKMEELLMGNGPSPKPDSKKSGTTRPAAKPPPDADQSLASVGGGLLGSDASAGGEANGSFCTRPQIAEFFVTAEIAPNTNVRLIIGEPPTVRSSSGGLVGELTGQTASAMRNCLEQGYAMDGTVTAQLFLAEIGRVVVKGHR